MKSSQITGVGIAVAAALVTALVVTGALVLAPRTAEVPTAGPRAGSVPSASATPTPVASPTISPDSVKEKKKAAASAAATAVTTVVTATNTLLAAPDAVPRDLEKYTGGFVEGEIRALAAERESLGYTQVGSAVITSITTRRTKLDGAPPTIYLNVCIDSSGIDVLDASGASLKASLYNPGHPVLNVYGAQYTGGSWKITTHSLPTSTKNPEKKEPCT